MNNMGISDKRPGTEPDYLHLAIISVMSSCCSGLLNCCTSFTISASRALGESSRFCARALSRRRSPYSSPRLLNASVTPSVQRTRVSPGASWRSSMVQLQSAKSPRTVPVERSSPLARVAQQDSRVVPAIGIAQAPGLIVVLAEEERGVGTVGRVFAKQAVHRLQEALRLLERDRALAAQVRLQVGHEQGGGDPFAGCVGDDHAQRAMAEIEKVIVVAAHGARLNADPGVLQRLELRQGLGEQAGLHLLGDFQFLGGAAFGFELFGRRSPLGLNLPNEVVASDK